MDLTVLHLAVPQLTRDLKPSSSQMLWIVDVYGFLVAGFLITMGTLGDRIGRRRVLLIGAAGFGAASTVAAFSFSAEMLIAARAALGIAGATLLPSTLALIRRMFVDERQRGVAIGIWVAIFSAGTAIGPVLGGALLDRFWWGSVFLLGVPVMVVLLLVGPALLPEFRDPDAGGLDPSSVALSLAGVLTVIYGLKLIAEEGVHWLPLLSIAVGIAVGFVFLRRQRKLLVPLIDLRLFRSRAFSVSLSAETLALFVWAGSYLFVAQYLQLVLGLSPMAAGLWLVPAGGGSFLGGMLAPTLARKLAPASVVSLGLVMEAIGSVMLTQLRVGDGVALVVGASALIAAGAAIVVTIATDLILGAAPPERAGTAAGIGETGNEIGLSLGIALIGSLGAAVYRHDLARTIPPGIASSAARAARETLAGALAVGETLTRSLGAELRVVAQQAFTQGLTFAAAFGAVVALGVALLVVVSLRRPRGRVDGNGPDD
jgi:DHA2 family multidrug resistance protein-like MFS transporter